MIKTITVLTGGQYVYRVGMEHKNKIINRIVVENNNEYVLYDKNNIIISKIISNSIEIEYE